MPEPLHLKDHFLEARTFSYRVVVVIILVVGLSAILIARFYNLQVINHLDYATQSDRNRVHVQSIAPTRGLIYDRNGVLLAENRPSYTLSIVKERVSDLDTTVALLQELVTILPTDRANFEKRLKQRRRPFETVPLRYRLSEEEIARIAVNEYRLEGVEVEAQLVRHYPLGDKLAHAVGYVGRISDSELVDFDEDQYRRYSGTHTIGKIGLEKQYESELLGEVGFQHVETNARGRVLRVLERTDPQPGKNLTLHLDSRLQRAGFEALGSSRGALVAVDVTTGGILAIVSAPSYNPNLFVTGISYKDFNALNESLDLPLFDRTLQGQYPPGSTLKPLLGLGALQHNIIDRDYQINDPGYYQLDGEERLYRDWTWKKTRSGHGHNVNLHMAIQQSCDTFFYDVAYRMGVDLMHPVGSAFGLGRRTGVDLPSERPGNWPSRQWKRAARGLPWFPGDSLNMGLGQGDVLATPLQLASMTATFAMRGKRKQPRLVKTVNNVDIIPNAMDPALADAPHWDYVFNAMKAVVHSARGTARGIGRGAKYTMAGKTGTAQVVGIKQGEEYDEQALVERQRDHALFVGFAPYEAPKVAVAVVVENAGSGSSKAAPIARKMFDAYMALEHQALENQKRLGINEGEP